MNSPFHPSAWSSRVSDQVVILKSSPTATDCFPQYLHGNYLCGTAYWWYDRTSLPQTTSNALWLGLGPGTNNEPVKFWDHPSPPLFGTWTQLNEVRHVTAGDVAKQFLSGLLPWCSVMPFLGLAQECWGFGVGTVAQERTWAINTITSHPISRTTVTTCQSKQLWADQHTVHLKAKLAGARQRHLNDSPWDSLRSGYQGQPNDTPCSNLVQLSCNSTCSKTAPIAWTWVFIGHSFPVGRTHF